MANNSGSFEVGIEFSSVLAAISKQIYDTPYAFLRENLQNAIDASRMQARRAKLSPGDPSLRIDIDVQGDSVRIRDRGIGMSSDDLHHLFWTIGASGKRNDEARAAGCVGMFGIGGFANLGVCEKLVVISQAEHSDGGNRTELGRSEIDSAVGLPHSGPTTIHRSLPTWNNSGGKTYSSSGREPASAVHRRDREVLS